DRGDSLPLHQDGPDPPRPHHEEAAYARPDGAGQVRHPQGPDRGGLTPATVALVETFAGLYNFGKPPDRGSKGREPCSDAACFPARSWPPPWRSRWASRSRGARPGRRRDLSRVPTTWSTRTTTFLSPAASRTRTPSPATRSPGCWSPAPTTRSARGRVQ